MLEVGKLYTIWGSQVMRIARITEDNIYVVWPNGQVPRRQCDRQHPITNAHRFVPVKDTP